MRSSSTICLLLLSLVPQAYAAGETNPVVNVSEKIDDGCRDVSTIKWTLSDNTYAPLEAWVKHTNPRSTDDIPAYQVSVLTQPEHGVLYQNEKHSPRKEEQWTWTYHGNPAYEGPDLVRYLIAFQQRHVELTLHYFVHNAPVEKTNSKKC